MMAVWWICLSVFASSSLWATADNSQEVEFAVPGQGLISLDV
jgi:hypothetical protein